MRTAPRLESFRIQLVSPARTVTALRFPETTEQEPSSSAMRGQGTGHNALTEHTSPAADSLALDGSEVPHSSQPHFAVDDEWSSEAESPGGLMLHSPLAGKVKGVCSRVGQSVTTHVGPGRKERQKGHFRSPGPTPAVPPAQSASTMALAALQARRDGQGVPHTPQLSRTTSRSNLPGALPSAPIPPLVHAAGMRKLPDAIHQAAVLQTSDFRPKDVLDLGKHAAHWRMLYHADEARFHTEVAGLQGELRVSHPIWRPVRC